MSDCPGPAWQRVVCDEADCDGDIAQTVTIAQLRATTLADVEAAIDAALAELPSTVRDVAKAKARVLVNERLDSWEVSARTALAGIH